MTAPTEWKKTFSCSGPWLHTGTQERPPDAHKLALILAKRLMAGDETTTPSSNDPIGVQLRLLKFTQSILGASDQMWPNVGKSDPNRLLAIKTFLTSSPGARAPLRTDLKRALPQAFLPAILFDALLHALDGRDETFAPVRDRMAMRPGECAAASTHFARVSYTSNMLSHGHARHQQYLAHKQHINPSQSARDVYLAQLRSCDASVIAGRRSIANIESVANVFGVLLMGDDITFSTSSWQNFFLRSILLAHLRSMKLTKQICSNAQRRGLPITMEDVKDAAPSPSNSHLLAATFVAIANSPLLLVYDVIQYAPRASLHNAQWMFEQWLDAGNELRLHESHCLSVLERHLWRLIFRVALNQITATQAVTKFFDHAHLQDIDRLAPMLNMLAFPEDLRPLIAMSADQKDEPSADGAPSAPASTEGPPNRASPETPPRSTAPGDSANTDTASNADSAHKAQKASARKEEKGAAPGPAPPASSFGLTEPPSGPSSGPGPVPASATAFSSATITDFASARALRLLSRSTAPGPAPPASSSRQPPSVPAPAPAAFTRRRVRFASASPACASDPGSEGDRGSPLTNIQESNDEESTSEKTQNSEKKRKRQETEPSERQTRSTTGSLKPPPSSLPAPPPPAKKAKTASKPSLASAPARSASDGRTRNIPWIRVMNSELPTVSDPEALKEMLRDETFSADRTYPLAKDEIALTYYKLEERDGVIVFTPKTYKHRAFKETSSDARKLKEIHDSQPKELEDGERKPLHTLRKARELPKGPPGRNESKIHVTTWKKWNNLTVRQQLGVLRYRYVLISCRELANPLPFTEEGLGRLTNPLGPAIIQDNGRRKNDEAAPIVAGRACDLLTVAAIRDQGKRPDKGQALNLLASHLGNMPLPVPQECWTEQTAATYLQRRSVVPRYILPQDDLKFAIFTNKGAVTWPHMNPFPTGFKIITGAKLWYVARDLEGNIAQRQYFDGYDPGDSMLDRYTWECVHLDANVALLTNATTIHHVVTIEDSIGVGFRGVPITNITPCVFTILHTVLVPSLATNAGHEAARLILLKILQFVVLLIVDPYSQSEGMKRDERYDPRRIYGGHLPDVTTKQGVVDLLALRSFAIIFLALDSQGYASLRDGALPVTEALCKEVEATWTLIAALDRQLTNLYILVDDRPQSERVQPLPKNFQEVAMIASLQMAGAMAKYHQDTPQYAERRPNDFTTEAFREQLRLMLVAYDHHQQRYNKVYDAQDPQKVTVTKFPKVTFDDTTPNPMSRSGINFDNFMTRELRNLQPWTEFSLPFRLKAIEY
ncbi:hypothetical protein GGX14DRAFT_558260 [Mycena pura]|uniref:Uncharacterized protein n=1 Tax=Mycena pura TaxID=153505 RepID=A0AAD6VVT3_9AGAR|nr:hypothetical protein GGX14DRAFT_558260 [Mycena pura]